MNPFPRAEAGAGHRNGAIQRPRDVDEERAARRAREKDRETERRIEEAMKAAASFPVTLALAIGAAPASDEVKGGNGVAADSSEKGGREEGNALRTPTAQGSGEPHEGTAQSDEGLQPAAAGPEADATAREKDSAAKDAKGQAPEASSRHGARAKDEATDDAPPLAWKVVASTAPSDGDAAASPPDLGSRNEPESGAAAAESRAGETSKSQIASSGSPLPSQDVGAPPTGRSLRAEAHASSRPAAEEAAVPDSRLASESGTPSWVRSSHRVVLDFAGEDGVEGRLRVALRGDRVHATIVSRDPGTARRLGNDLNELERALSSRGFTQSHLSVQQGRAESAPASPQPSRHEDPRPQDRGRGGEGTSQEDGSQDAHSGRSRPSQQQREKR